MQFSYSIAHYEQQKQVTITMTDIVCIIIINHQNRETRESCRSAARNRHIYDISVLPPHKLK